MILTGTFPHGGITSSMDNGTIFGSHSTNGTTLTPLLDGGFHHGISSSVPNSLSSLARVGSVGNQSTVSDSGPSQGEMKLDFHGIASLHPHSLPDYQDRLGNGASSNSPGQITSGISARASEIIENHKLNEGGKYIELYISCFVQFLSFSSLMIELINII